MNESVGNTLRGARKSKGLSKEEVARALCLSVNIIDALERDAYDELPAKVFAKGYTRNYANFLGIQLMLEENQEAKISNHQSEPNKLLLILGLLGHLFIKSLNYIVILTLGFLLFMWWHEKHHAQIEEMSIGKSTVNSLHSRNE